MSEKDYEQPPSIAQLIGINTKLGKSNRQLKAENERLKEFTRHVIRQECWSIFPQDGGDIQELAEKLGLIAPCAATEEDVDEESDYGVGDKIYKFSELLQETDG